MGHILFYIILAAPVILYLINDIDLIHNDNDFVCKISDTIYRILNTIFNIGGIIWKGLLFLVGLSFIVWLFCSTKVGDRVNAIVPWETNWDLEPKDIITNLLWALAVIVAYITYWRNDFAGRLNSYIEQNRNLHEAIVKDKPFDELYEEFEYIYEICDRINPSGDVEKKLQLANDIFYYGEGYLNTIKDTNIKHRFYQCKYKPDKIKPKNEKLGIYYRNIYQSIKYIHNAILLTARQKKEYAKLVRTQISDYGQLMLYYNTFSARGRAWTNKDKYGVSLIEHYSLIENVPLCKFVGIDPSNLFKSIDYEYNYIKDNK